MPLYRAIEKTTGLDKATELGINIVEFVCIAGPWLWRGWVAFVQAIALVLGGVSDYKRLGGR